jgi:hypothetical protein
MRHFERRPPSTDSGHVLCQWERIIAEAAGGRQIGYLDTHLPAATALAGSVRWWARDPRLAAVARALKAGPP